MKNLKWMILMLIATLAACGSPTTESNDELTKEEAAAMGGKSDHFGDICEALDWYGDGICDEFCLNPDPDCPGECATDADCAADEICEHFATCAAIGCPPPPPSQCTEANCDDGSSLSPFCDIRPVCEDGQISAVIGGCFQCVDKVTCAPPEMELCGDGSSLNPLCDIRPLCDDDEVSVVQNGCFVCVDPGTCEPDETGKFCGGIAGIQCGDGFTCVQDIGMCNVADGGGTCQPVADACAEIFFPVCGCDGKDYGNHCEANMAGVGVDFEGSCDKMCGGIAGIQCGNGETCVMEPGMCNVADAAGTCQVVGNVCPAVIDPVCGCDGITYQNSCQATQQGVAIDRDGAC